MKGKKVSEVKLIAYTQSKEIAGITSQDIMAYCARVSNPSNQDNYHTADKLLNYCVKHKHWSVFEMCNVVQEINTTRDIARQILRHRSFHFQEFSQRYADPAELGFETREARLQDAKNRQNSIESEDQLMAQDWKLRQANLMKRVQQEYKWAIDQGIAKEQARAVLSEGMMMSRMYMNGTIRDWIHYCQLRMGPETQKEHRIVAQQCWDNLVQVYPFLKTLDVGE
jgi:thymidylate synthase (FAD)